MPEFSPRERKAIALLVTGMSNKEIAVAIGTSEQAVKNNLRDIYKKSGVKDRTNFVLHYYRKAIEVYAAKGMENDAADTF
jgi:DNA-binding NarL/FixJ family response regulator